MLFKELCKCEPQKSRLARFRLTVFLSRSGETDGDGFLSPSHLNPQCRFSTYVWLVVAFPPLAVVHCLACCVSWLLVFTIPVAKMNARTLTTVLLLPPENVQIQTREKVRGSVHLVAMFVTPLPGFGGRWA